VAILFNAADPQVNLERDAAQAAAQTLILYIIRLEIRPGEDIATAIESLRGRAEAVNVRLPPEADIPRRHLDVRFGS
jgi:hypothetical protein